MINKDQDLPLVSIVIPCYNSDMYIGECIDSILNQNYENIEVIVVNDGSTDKSIDVLNSYQNITVYSQLNSGACVARNNGLYKSNGKYIKFLDADDFLEPNVITEQVKLAEELDDNTIVYGDYYELRNGKKSYQNILINKSEQTALLILGYILTSTPLHRKWMLEKVKGFDERFKNGQEWNLHIRLSSEGFVFHHQKCPISNYRIHNGADRISVIKNKNNEEKVYYEILKTEMTKERLSDNSTGDIDAALALKYWSIARSLHAIGNYKESKYYLEKSKLLSVNYKKYWSSKYRMTYGILGFELSQKIMKLYIMSRKDKFI